MTSNQEAAPNDKPVTSIVDHLFKEFLAKKSEVLQQESTVECQQTVKAEEISAKGEPDQNTSDISEEMHSRKHSERHDIKKEKKHKKHKHKEKSHSKKKHKHKRHHSDREYDKIDVKNDSEIDRWTNDELKIDTDTGSDVTDTMTQQDGLKHHSHFSSKDDASLLSATDADSKNNDKQHKKYKKGERRLDSGGQPTKLEHLWQEEEVSDKEMDQASTHPSLQDDSTMESEVASGVTGGWMTLPKELEKNPAVNADNWMKLPDDLSNLEKDHLSENDHLVDDVNSKKACSNPDCNEANEQNSEQSSQPALKLDIKIDISKVAKVLPPPTHITKEVVSSIKSTLNNDVIKSEETQDKPPVFEPETSHEKPETDMEKMEPKVPPGKMKLGIKISETSAALISSGKKMDDNMADTTAEEGEITDSATSGQADGAPDKDLDTRSSSEISVGHLSSSDSVSGSDSGDEKPDQDSPKRKERKHKKKKKKGHKRKKRERSSSRSHSWKKHKHSRSRSSSRSKSRSRSRSRSRSGRDIRAKSFDEERGVWRSRSRSKSRCHRRSRSPDYYSRHSRETYYRSKSRDHHYDYHRSRPYHRYKSRSRSKSRSKSPAVKQPTQDARLQIDKAQLRKIAFQNAYAHLRKGQLPNLGLKPAEVAALKAGGKSVEELTDFCKKISEKGESFIPSEESDADGKENSSDNEAPFVHHPFKMRDNASIVMNIRNARQLPVLTAAQKQALGNELRLQFPVSSGTQHRDKEREWVPVETPNTTSTASIAATMAKPDMKPDAMVTPAAAGPMKPDDKVFPDVPNVQINIRDVVSERLSALRRLSENPNDPQAMGAMCRAQEAMNKWVQSKDLPGYFTGSTGANVLSQAELAGMTQAWARKDQLINAAPVTGGIGKFLLKKMGWKEGEGLGKAGAGSKEPIMLDFKLDRKGLASTGEAMKKTPTIPLTKDLSNKHPVSALVELCNRRKWQPPNFVLVHESGPDHKKNFLFKVIVNGNEYQSTIVSTNKKHAKAQAATVCLQQLGLVPR